jgi:hypothetical protein
MTFRVIPWSLSSPNASTAFHRTRSPPPPAEQNGWKKATSLGLDFFGAFRRNFTLSQQIVKANNRNHPLAAWISTDVNGSSIGVGIVRCGLSFADENTNE